MNFYGGLKPTAVIGQKQFASHDATSTWEDGGVAVELAADAMRQAEDEITRAVESIRQRFQEDLAIYGAHQVRDAVVDYVSNGYLDVSLVNDKLCVCFDASNDKAQLVAAWDLSLLLRRAANEAMNKGDSEVYEAIANLVDALPAPRTTQRPAKSEFREEAVSAPIGKRPKGVVRSRDVRSMA